MNLKKYLIPVAVILACALVLFAASAGLAGTEEAREAELFDTLMQQLLPGGGEYEAVEYSGSDSNITAVYSGEYGVVVDTTVPGFNNPVRTLVGVTNDGVVYSVCVLENHNTYGLGMAAMNDWDFLCSLTGSEGDLTVTDVDVVAGATITSSAIMSAVNSAANYVLDSSAGGPLTGTAEGFAGPITVEVTMDGDTITAVTVVSNSETPAVAAGALEQIPAAIVEANSADVDIVAGATYTSNGIINAVKAALENAGSTGGDGGLTGTAEGFAGPITVSVTMDGDTITGVTVVSNSETPAIAGGALEQIPAAIVEANSPDVDIVAGATYTSNGIINAVKDAIGA